ncbi:hypothetical protein [Bradyrhizobium sp. 156]|uniref:hypothetical protein n=1 Tax=Bradyrhizobium sp. 156 TaxID=2782630 RepID=UPI001FF929C9|nr:hypothetical protein [Bradyrhizobium sp. 156]
MRRVIAIALAGVSLLGAATLAGCSSMSSTSWDMFKSAPPTVQVRLESNPPGADATTSLGAGCKTPCSVAVPAPDAPFTVAFALPKYQPVSVPVNVIKNPGDLTTPASITTSAKTGPQAAPPEETETGGGRGRPGCCRTGCGLAFPRSERGQALTSVIPHLSLTHSMLRLLPGHR